MLPRDMDAIFYVGQPPVIELRDGLVHVCYEIGRTARFEIVLSPNVFLKALRRANQVSDEFHEGTGHVLPFKR